MRLSLGMALIIFAADRCRPSCSVPIWLTMFVHDWRFSDCDVLEKLRLAPPKCEELDKGKHELLGQASGIHHNRWASLEGPGQY